MSRTIQMAGERYGNLTVIQQVRKMKPGEEAKWECRCNCGAPDCEGTVVIRGFDLRNGKRTNCKPRKAYAGWMIRK